MHNWRFSKAYEDFMEFLHNVNDAILNVETASDVRISAQCMNLIEMLDIFKKWITEFPPENMSAQRYGNKAFRKWFNKLQVNGRDILLTSLGEKFSPYVEELLPYLMDSFGNSERIDYGSGHEAQFLIFLLCLLKIGYLSANDYKSIALRVFNSYLKLCRNLQVVYKLEPAGSRGVSAIDDYHFMPFLWGSAQIIDQKRFIPDHYLNIDKVELYAHRSLFVEAILFIYNTKMGPFNEHSNKLWNISNVKTWRKVNEGMFKMYEAEVLRQFPIVQHFLFGKLFSFDEADSAPKEPLERTKTPNMENYSIENGDVGSVTATKIIDNESVHEVTHKPNLETILE